MNWCGKIHKWWKASWEALALDFLKKKPPEYFNNVIISLSPTLESEFLLLPLTLSCSLFLFCYTQCSQLILFSLCLSFSHMLYVWPQNIKQNRVVKTWKPVKAYLRLSYFSFHRSSSWIGFTCRRWSAPVMSTPRNVRTSSSFWVRWVLHWWILLARPYASHLSRLHWYYHTHTAVHVWSIWQMGHMAAWSSKMDDKWLLCPGISARRAV